MGPVLGDVQGELRFCTLSIKLPELLVRRRLEPSARNQCHAQLASGSKAARSRRSLFSALPWATDSFVLVDGSALQTAHRERLGTCYYSNAGCQDTLITDSSRHKSRRMIINICLLLCVNKININSYNRGTGSPERITNKYLFTR